MPFERIIGKQLTTQFPFPLLDQPSLELPEWLKNKDRWASSKERWSLAKDVPPYLKMEKVRVDDTPYHFIQTVVNPEAAKAIRTSDAARKHEKEDIDFYFGEGLMEVYLAALSDAAQECRIRHWMYPRVDSSGLRGNIGTSTFVNWPVVHMIEGADQSRLGDYKDLILREAQDFKITREKMKNDRFIPSQLEIVAKSKVSPFSIVGPDVMRTGKQVATEGHPFQLYRFVYTSEHRTDPAFDD